LNEDGFTYSELSKDLQALGIQCIEDVPQIKEVREMHQTLSGQNLYEENNLLSNIQSTLGMKNEGQIVLD